MSKIGALEETVLLLCGALGEDAYAVSIANEYMDRMKQEISVPAIHTVLKRLEDKGYLKSYYSKPTQERGGRKKRIYQITNTGYSVIAEAKLQRDALWSMIPNMGV